MKKSAQKESSSQTQIFNLAVLFRPEPEGGFTVLVPSLPGCISYGKDLKQARAMAHEAIELYLESLRDHGETLPSDDPPFVSTVTVSIPFVVHA